MSETTLLELEKKREKYHAGLLAALGDEEEPLSLYEQFIKWTTDSYPTHSLPQSNIVALLEEATRHFVSNTSYKNNQQYVKMWLSYALYVEDSLVVYSFLIKSGIGTDFASLYEEYALSLERAGRRPDAEKVYALGIKRRARPIERLKKHYTAFKARTTPPVISPASLAAKIASLNWKDAPQHIQALRRRPLRNHPKPTKPTTVSTSSSTSKANANTMPPPPVPTIDIQPPSISSDTGRQTRYAIILAALSAPKPRPEKHHFTLTHLLVSSPTGEHTEYSVQEARAKSMGLLGKKWGPPPEEATAKTSRVSFADAESTRNGKSGLTTRSKYIGGGAEPTVTIATKEALADVFGMYNSPDRTGKLGGMVGSKYAPVRRVEPIAPMGSLQNLGEGSKSGMTSGITFKPFVDENAGVQGKKENGPPALTKFSIFVDDPPPSSEHPLTKENPPQKENAAPQSSRRALGVKAIPAPTPAPAVSNENAGRAAGRALGEKRTFSRNDVFMDDDEGDEEHEQDRLSVPPQVPFRVFSRPPSAAGQNRSISGTPSPSQSPQRQLQLSSQNRSNPFLDDASGGLSILASSSRSVTDQARPSPLAQLVAEPEQDQEREDEYEQEYEHRGGLEGYRNGRTASLQSLQSFQGGISSASTTTTDEEYYQYQQEQYQAQMQMGVEGGDGEEFYDEVSTEESSEGHGGMFEGDPNQGIDGEVVAEVEEGYSMYDEDDDETQEAYGGRYHHPTGPNHAHHNPNMNAYPYQRGYDGQDENGEEYDQVLSEDEIDPARVPMGGRLGSFNVMTPITERTCEFTMSTRGGWTPKVPGVREDEDEDEQEGEGDTGMRRRLFGGDEARGVAESLAAELREDEEDAGRMVDDERQAVGQIEERTTSLSLSDALHLASSFAPPNPCNPFSPRILSTLLSLLPPEPMFFDHGKVQTGFLEELDKWAKKAGRKSGGSMGRGRGAREEDRLEIEVGGKRYGVVGKLGEGGFGAVFEAIDLSAFEERRTARREQHDADDSVSDISDLSDEDEDEIPKVALKVTNPRSLWEYHVLKKLHHTLVPSLVPSLVTPYALHAYATESVLVLSLSSQGTLLDLVNGASKAGIAQQGACLDELLVVFFTIELLKLVEGLHTKGFIHGDLKIDNTLLRYAPPSSASQWSAQYSPEGAGGWSGIGVTLIDFGRTIDTRQFPAGQKYKGDWDTDARDCVEMREGRSWSYETDYFGLAGVVYCMLFGKYIEAASIALTPSESGEKARYKLTTPLKRYWQTALWTSLFDVLLNPGLQRRSGELPVVEELSWVRVEMEKWLVGNCGRGSNTLKGLMKKIGLSLLGGKGA